MADRLAQVAEVLAEHRSVSRRQAHALYSVTGCSCGAAPVNMPAHQADMLRAKGLVASEVQWSVVYDGGDYDRTHLPGPSDVDGYDTRAEAEDGMPPSRRITITRGATPWRAADEGGERG